MNMLVNLVMLRCELGAGVCWRVLSCEGVKRIVGWNVVNVHISIYITQHNTPLIEMQLFVRIKLPWPAIMFTSSTSTQLLWLGSTWHQERNSGM